MTAWQQAGKPVEQVLSVSAVDFEKDHWNLNLCVIDIRRPGEYETAHISDVPNNHSTISTTGYHLWTATRHTTYTAPAATAL